MPPREIRSKTPPTQNLNNSHPKPAAAGPLSIRVKTVHNGPMMLQ
jgi:hypothetical protein